MQMNISNIFDCMQIIYDKFLCVHFVHTVQLANKQKKKDLHCGCLQIIIKNKKTIKIEIVFGLS